MPHWPALALIATQGFVLVTMAARGWWRRYPAFAISLIIGIAFESRYQPGSPAWLQRWYFLGVGLVLIWRSAAFFEAWLYQTRRFPLRWNLFLLQASVSIMAGGAAAWLFHPEGWVFTMIQIRRSVVILEAVFLLAGLLFFWENPEWQSENRGDLRHVCIQTGLAWAYAASAVLRILWGRGDWWWTADPALYITVACGYAAWTALMWRCPRPSAGGSRSTAPDHRVACIGN